MKNEEDNMLHIDCSVEDRYGNKLNTKISKPTIEQALLAWCLINELLDAGYCHDWQYERSDIVDYIQRISEIMDKAYEIRNMNPAQE